MRVTEESGLCAWRSRMKKANVDGAGPALNDWWHRPLRNFGMTAGPPRATTCSHLLAFRGCFSRRARRKRDSPSNLLTGVIHDVSKGFRAFIQTRFQKWTRLWIGGDTLPSFFLAFLPKISERFPWNTKDGEPVIPSMPRPIPSRSAEDHA